MTFMAIRDIEAKTRFSFASRELGNSRNSPKIRLRERIPPLQRLNWPYECSDEGALKLG